jgi:arylformamidase
MITAQLTHHNRTYQVNLLQPHPLALPVNPIAPSLHAFHIPPPVASPFTSGSFVGAVAQGSSCNVNNIFFNPHGHCTHTECVAHISDRFYNVNDVVPHHLFAATLLTVTPELMDGNSIITTALLKPLMHLAPTPALLLRTPASALSIPKIFSGTNPTFLHHTTAALIRSLGYHHLMLDLPSVDQEHDGGLLLAHKAFWNYPQTYDTSRTITELIHLPAHLPDGLYACNLLMAPIINDATPSNPILYSLS